MPGATKANPKGYGAPFARVYYGDRELTFHLNKFIYTMSEDQDDGLEMVFESNDPNMPDDPAFQEHAQLVILWGYINGLQSDKRKVYVREVSPEFTDNGVSIRIKASDKLSYLKTTSRLHKNPLENKTTNEIIDELATQWGVNRVNPVYYSDGTVAYQLDERWGEEEADKVNVITGNAGTKDEFKIETPIFGSAQDNARVVGHSLITLHEQWLPGNKNDFENIKEILYREPDGPYVMEGRDDNIIIKKRKFDLTPFRTFKYKSDDELIKFNPESKNRVNKATSVNINLGLSDRENKEYTEQNITEEDDDNTRLGDVVDGTYQGKGIKRFSNGTEISTDGDLQGTGVSKRTGKNDRQHGESGGVNVFSSAVYLIENPDDPEQSKVILKGKPGQTERDGYIGDDGNWKTEVDATSTGFIPAALLDVKEFMEISEDAKDGEIGNSMANNRRSGAALDKNPGSAIMIGDPRITCGMILTFENVSKKFSGNYYVTTVVHDLDFNRGYTITTTIKRNAIGRTGNEGPDKVTTTSLNKKTNKKKSDNKKEQTKTVPINTNTTDKPLNTYTNTLGIDPATDAYLRPK